MQQQNLFITTEEVSAQFKDMLTRGFDGDCPCCGRYCKVYQRRIHANMARQLIALYRISENNKRADGSPYVHTRQVRDVCEYSDFTLGKHWDLVQAKLNHDEPLKNETGFWRLTPRGEQFVRGEIALPTHAFLFDDKVIGFSETTSTIKDALANKFNYAELMS